MPAMSQRNSVPRVESAAPAEDKCWRRRIAAIRDEEEEQEEDAYTRFVQAASPVGAELLPEAEAIAPVKAVRLLSADDIAALHAAAARMEAEYEPSHKCMYAHFGPKSFHATRHAVLYFHRDGWVAREVPALLDRLVRAMLAHAWWCERDASLSVRCVELHTYGVDASLPNPGHRDRGSAVTMSVLLSEPSRHEGGVFVVWDRHGRPVEQALEQGDAVVFHSERAHNVSPVLSGERHSLVLELWTGTANSLDRNE